jgi:hypothetical protein
MICRRMHLRGSLRNARRNARKRSRRLASRNTGGPSSLARFKGAIPNFLWIRIGVSAAHFETTRCIERAPALRMSESSPVGCCRLRRL